MTAMSTQELIDRYFKSEVTPSSERKTRGTIDRPELYEYEVKIGKQLVEMNLDEIADMLFTFTNSVKNGQKTPLSTRTLTAVLSTIRSIIYFYSENFSEVPINNPLRNGAKCKEALSIREKKHSVSALNTDDYKELIRKIRTTYVEDKATYYECMVRLFYEGISSMRELATLREDQIDFENKRLVLPNRTVQLTDRCFELLVAVGNMTIMESERYKYTMAKRPNSYFRYPTRVSKTSDGISDWDDDLFATNLSKRFANINELSNKSITAYNLFMLGFTDCLIEKYGYEEIKERFEEPNTSRAAEILQVEATSRGVVITNMSHTKQFIARML